MIITVDAAAQHARDVAHIQERMRSFYACGKKVRIYHGATNSTRGKALERDACIDTSRLNRILAIRAEERYALVEPNVPMDKLVGESLKHGLVPPVVPEFPGITVGGGVQGGAEESSSFRYGMLHDCCSEYEIVLGDGELTVASPAQNAEIFHGIAASYGSLGVITRIKLNLVPARDYVRLAYRAVHSAEEAVALIKQKSADPATRFLDAVLFSASHGVVMTGDFADRSGLPVCTVSRHADEWFYLHARDVSSAQETYEELMPTRDYLFRYDKGAFWMGRYGFKILKLPFNKLMRLLFSPLCDARTLYRILHEMRLSQDYLIQDFNLPSENASRFLNIIGEKTGIYPLWLCPLRPGERDKLSANCIKTDLVFNIGVYGEAGKHHIDRVQLNRELEREAHALGGRKMLYAHQYYSPEAFWKIYDHEWYRSLRSACRADTVFPTIYEKTKTTKKRRRSIFLGFVRAMLAPALNSLEAPALAAPRMSVPRVLAPAYARIAAGAKQSKQ